MMKTCPVLIILFILLIIPSVSLAEDQSKESNDYSKKETPHYDVVAEYIRSLGAIHNIQHIATQELQEDNNTDNPEISKMMSAIRNSTRVKLELNASISALENMKLKKSFDTLLPTTIEFYKNKITLH
jgi:hypothetical protein